MTAETLIQSTLKPVGIHINGNNPWDIRINNQQAFSRIINDGALGLGEAYMDNWWDCERLDMFFDRVLRAKLDEKTNISLRHYFYYFFSKILNYQSKTRAKEVAHKHYNLSNELFTLMLDKRMMYSCAYWKNAANLDEAQEAKLELICQKLQLKPGMTLLDIGCGWGGMAKYAAEKYGARVVGITISDQQANYAKAHCKDLPIEIRLQDYRDVNETFDRVVSIGMFEHVGIKNYDTYMQTVHKILKDDGLFLLHTIGNNQSNLMTNEWTLKYIFPNGMLPSAAQIAETSEKYFVMEDWHNFGAHYDKTLMAWYQNFTTHWDDIKQDFDDRFYRMWTYYLLSCAGAFRSRSIQLWQIMFSKNGILGGYVAPR